MIAQEQPLPTTGHQSVTAALRALLDERERKGIETYGQSLMTFTGRSAERDLVEELIDATQYALQARMERQALEQRLRNAERTRDDAPEAEDVGGPLGRLGRRVAVAEREARERAEDCARLEVAVRDLSASRDRAEVALMAVRGQSKERGTADELTAAWADDAEIDLMWAVSAFERDAEGHPYPPHAYLAWHKSALSVLSRRRAIRDSDAAKDDPVRLVVPALTPETPEPHIATCVECANFVSEGWRCRARNRGVEPGEIACVLFSVDSEAPNGR